MSALVRSLRDGSPLQITRKSPSLSRGNTPIRSGGVPIQQPFQFIRKSSSNSRSLSASREKAIVDEAIEIINSRRRPQSSRRQKRMESERVVDSLKIYSKALQNTMNYDERNLDEDNYQDVDDSAYMIVDWRSAFVSLMHGENLRARECFLNGQGSKDNKNKMKKSRNQNNLGFACELWKKVDKKLRSVVPAAINQDVYARFVIGLETIVYFFLEREQAPPPVMIVKEIQEVLLEPMKVVNSKLIICLKDSAFHRILLHAVCQFHRLISKSETVSKHRITRVWKPKNDNFKPHQISLLFLLDKNLIHSKDQVQTSQVEVPSFVKTLVDERSNHEIIDLTVND